MKRLRTRCFLLILGVLLGLSIALPGEVSAESLKKKQQVSTDNVIVFFADNAPAGKTKTAISKKGFVFTELSQDVEKMALVNVPVGETVTETMKELETVPGIEKVQPNYLYYLDESAETGQVIISNDLLAEQQWNLDYIDAKEAWDLIDEIRFSEERQEDELIRIATIDTGVYRNNDDMNTNIDWEHTVSILGDSPYVASKTPVASHGMGTSGIIAATSNNNFGIAGIAAGNANDLIELMAINVFHMDEYTNNACATTADIIKGLEYACENDAKVIVMCLGHTTGAVDYSGQPHDDKALEAAINHAVYDEDVVICSTAGNQGDTRDWYPGDFDACISVINTKMYSNAWSKKVKNTSSSYGTKKDISAPGTKVYLPDKNNTFRVSTGTSFAAPTVAAVAALVRYVNPELTAAEVKEILFSTAEDLYTEGYDEYTGYGNVNAYRAVAKAANVEIEENRELMPAVEGVTAESIGSQTIKLKWDSMESAQGYQILKSTSLKGPYKVIAETKASVTSFKDKKCRFNRKYYYKIRTKGTSDDGKKIYSKPGKVVSGKAITAIPKLTLSNVNYKTIKLSWNKVKKSSGYIIYRSDSKNGKYKKVKTLKSGSFTSWNDTTCKSGKTYYYKIKSYRTQNGVTAYTEASKSYSLVAKPGKPSITVKKAGTKAKVSWGKNNHVTGYQLYRAYSKNGKWKKVRSFKKASSYTTGKLKKGRRVYFKMRVYKVVNGKRVYSDFSSVKSVKR